MINTIGHGKIPTIVVKGPTFSPFKEKERGIEINLLLINSAVTALVTNKPTRKTNNHCFRSFLNSLFIFREHNNKENV
jgi:hypothetical protein